MASTAGWLLLQATMLASVVMPTEYSQLSTQTNRCLRRIKACGDFQAPQPDVGSWDCIFNNKNCDFTCVLTCPRQSKDIWMTISNKRFSKDLYTCHNGVWKRRETQQQAFCIAKISVKEVQQNFHHVIEVNNLVGALLNTSYVYLAMASFYERADVALPGFSKFMTDIWRDEVKHTRDFMSYVNRRGGYISLTDIPRPSTNEVLLMNISRPGLVGLEVALNVAHDIKGLALDLHKTATMSKRFSDPHLKYYLEDGLISDKTNSIKKLSDLIKQLKKFSDEDYEIGEYIIDLNIGGEHKQISV